MPPKKFMRVPFLRSFPGNEAHTLFSGGPKWGVFGGGGGRKEFQGSVNGGFQTVVRVLWGNEILLPPFYPRFYLDFNLDFNLNFNLDLTSAQPALSNHGLETTDCIPLGF